MSFEYHQTVRFGRTGWLAIDVSADDAHPLSPSDLAFVMGLARLSVEFEHARLIERRPARKPQMPLCWPGFRPLP